MRTVCVLADFFSVSSTEWGVCLWSLTSEEWEGGSDRFKMDQKRMDRTCQLLWLFT